MVIYCAEYGCSIIQGLMAWMTDHWNEKEKKIPLFQLRVGLNINKICIEKTAYMWFCLGP